MYWPTKLDQGDRVYASVGSVRLCLKAGDVRLSANSCVHGKRLYERNALFRFVQSYVECDPNRLPPRMKDFTTV